MLSHCRKRREKKKKKEERKKEIEREKTARRKKRKKEKGENGKMALKQKLKSSSLFQENGHLQRKKRDNSFFATPPFRSFFQVALFRKL